MIVWSNKFGDYTKEQLVKEAELHAEMAVEEWWDDFDGTGDPFENLLDWTRHCYYDGSDHVDEWHGLNEVDSNLATDILQQAWDDFVPDDDEEEDDESGWN